MLDVTKKISNLLKGIAHIELAGSEAPLTMPSIYITQASASTAVRMDNKDFLTEFIYQLDIYAETPGRCVEIAQAVDDIMQGDGWQRQNGFPKNGNAQTVGALVFDALLDDGMNNDKTGSFTAANGVTYAKYGKDGQLSSAYEAYIRGNTNKTVTNNTTNNTQQPVVYSPNILIDGTKITSVVVEGINAITRSSGNSPLVEMGG